jgi:glutamine cyclotransferase
LNIGQVVSALALVVVTVLPTRAQKMQSHPVPEYGFKVLHVYPHDPQAFTQGLVYHKGFFYEGTGIKGKSSLRKVKLETGEVVQRFDISPSYFGEGIAILGNRIIQLTWTSHKAFVYNLSDFQLIGQFPYEGEGWGLASDGVDLYLSDGSAQIRVLDGKTYKEKRRITVHDGETPVTELNELEIVNGQIFANIWHSDRIARISPKTGQVVGWIDLSGLLSPMYKLDKEAVLNGIAWDAAGKRLFVTGKLWPQIFEIQLMRKTMER